MIIDTSAIVAVVRGEPEAARCLNSIVNASDRRISAGNLLEAYFVIDGAKNLALSADLDATVSDFQLVVVPVNRAQVEVAREAFRWFGKGSGLPARLNYGDCFAYGLARFMGEPLLFVGNDFAQTDLVRVL